MTNDPDASPEKPEEPAASPDTSEPAEAAEAAKETPETAQEAAPETPSEAAVSADTGGAGAAEDETHEDVAAAPAKDVPVKRPAPRTPAAQRSAGSAAPAPTAAAGTAAKPAKTVALTVLITLAVAVAAVASFLAVRYHGELRDERAAAADRAHAEDIASQYGVAASTVDFNDLAPWLQAMKTNVSDDLAKKFDATAETMRQVVVPLRMQSKGTVVVTKVTDEVNGVYKVSTVIDMSSTSLQAPQGVVTTTAYTVTVDRNKDWKITSTGDAASAAGLPAGSAAAAGAPAPPAQQTPAPAGDPQPGG